MKMVMRRKDVFDEFYARNEDKFKSKTEAKMVFDDMFAMIDELLRDGNELVITGFGKFWVSRLKPRPVRNPRTQTTAMGEARNAVRFTPGTTMRRNINSN